MAFEIIPISFYSMWQDQSWGSSQWLEYKKRLNPWDDTMLARIQLLRFNCLRQIHLRDADMIRAYWRHVGGVDAIMAEAEHEEYVNEYEALDHLERCYITNHYLAKDVEQLVRWQSDSKPIIDAKNAPETEDTTYYGWRPRSEHERNRIRIGLQRHLIPSDSPFNADYMVPIINANSEKLQWPTEIVALPLSESQRYQLRRWRDHLAQIQLDLSSSLNYLMQSLAWADKESSNLKKPYSHTHTLLVNHEIPRPVPASAFAWQSIAGIVCRRLSESERGAWNRLCDFAPHIIFTYQTPTLASTKEQINHGGVGNFDDSSSDHSLPYRNSGHRKLKSGSIDHGLWKVRTILLGERAEEHHLIGESIPRGDGGSTYFYHRAHADMVPWAQDSYELYRRGSTLNRDIFAPGINYREATGIISGISDPWSNNGRPLPITWPMMRYSLDLPWRAMAKFYGAMFRFDSTDEGMDALRSWCKAFEDAVCSYAFMTRTQRQSMYFDAALKITYANMGIKVNAKERETVGGGHTTFDLSSLMGKSEE